MSHVPTVRATMGKEKLIFVVVLRYRGSIHEDRVFVSTTLRGVCRNSGLEYKRMAKRWERRGKMELIGESNFQGLDERTWYMTQVGLDVVYGRGDKEFGRRQAEKRSEGGQAFRGYKGGDGRLHPAKGKKLMLGDEPVNTWKEGDPE